MTGAPMPRWAGARRRFQEATTLDLRSLACMRVLTGGVVVWDVLDRARDLTAHYTDAGVLPVATARALVDHFGWFSLHTLSGSFGYQLALAILTLLLGLALAAGLATRIVTPLCWVLCVSVQNRFCLADYPGDYLLPVLLLTGCFLPWGAWFSADAWRRRRRGGDAGPPAPRYRGVSARALLVLFALFLGTAGLSKITAGGSWLDGSALFLTLSSARYAGGWLEWTLSYPAFLEPISLAIPWIELALPALLVLPWRNGPVRTAAIAGACAMFTSFSVGLDLGAFPFLAGVAAVGLLPPWCWERLLPARRRAAAAASAAPAAPAVTRDVDLLPRRAARVNDALAIFFLLLHVTHHGYKIANFGSSSPLSPPAVVDRAMHFFRIENIYRMFADPRVFAQSDGWDVAPGELASGRKVDVFTGRALSFEPPASAIEALGSLRWRQYLTLIHWYPTWDPKNITSYHVVDYATLREGLVRFLCRRWNARHDGADRLVHVNLVMVIARARYARPKAPPQVVELLERAHRCEDAAPAARSAGHAR
ncbi:MAG TPA: hypothetical protein VK932_15010 [Kofleriaceae bacterium]|nr:hypothetical protein [Kofleriaceae bacterium]